MRSRVSKGLLCVVVVLLMTTLSAYFVTRDRSGAWTQQAEFFPSGVAMRDHGFSVSVSGDTAVIGAAYDDDNGGLSGSAYVFTRDRSGVWTQQAKLTASDGKMNDQLGYSVSITSVQPKPVEPQLVKFYSRQCF